MNNFCIYGQEHYYYKRNDNMGSKHFEKKKWKQTNCSYNSMRLDCYHENNAYNTAVSEEKKM